MPTDPKTAQTGCIGTLILFAIVGAAGIAIDNSGSSSSSTGPQGSSVYVRRKTWHDGKWPFTVPAGVLACVQPPVAGAVTFNANGKVYAVNGTAGDNGYRDIHPIWRKAPHGLRVDIGGMIDQGLKLCSP